MPEHHFAKLAGLDELVPVVEVGRRAPRPFPLLKDADDSDPAPQRSIDGVVKKNAATLQHTGYFSDHLAGILDVLEDVAADDDIMRFGGEGQPLARSREIADGESG